MTARRISILGLIALIAPAAAFAQSLGFGGNSGGTPQPINITASNGIAWNQKARTVTAMGNAQAVRGKVTITADRLIAHYQPKPGAKAGGGRGRSRPRHRMRSPASIPGNRRSASSTRSATCIFSPGPIKHSAIMRSIIWRAANWC